MGGVWDRGRVRRGEGLHGSNKCNGKFAFAGHGAVRNESRGGEKGAKGELLTFFLYLTDIFPPSRRDKFVSRHHSPSFSKRYNFPLQSPPSLANRNGVRYTHTHTHTLREFRSSFKDS